MPSLFVLSAALGSLVTVGLDRRLVGSESWLFFDGGPSSAEQILTTIAASTITVTGLVFTITVVVLQVASNQFSPRVLRTFLRDRGSQVPLGVFTATFVYALFVLVRVRTGVVGPAFVPRLSVSVSFVLIMSSMGALVYFVNHVAQSIRVVNIIESVAAETRDTIDAVFPADGAEARDGTHPVPLTHPLQTIRFERYGGVIAGLNIEAIVEEARVRGCVLRLVPAMGEFVVEQATLFEVFDPADAITFADIGGHVDFSHERTMRLDPAYGFRLLVDIAAKALSPALNDPTTAVQAIDRLHDLLGRVARRPTPSGRYYDAAGQLRFVREIVAWDALVALSFEEIREYGATSMQVHRRLHAAIESLLNTVPHQHRDPLLRQLRLLESSDSRSFTDAEERKLASEADESGIGNVGQARRPT